MPGKRAAAVVLSAALLTGAIAGGTAAASRVDPWGLLKLAGLTRAEATPELTEGPTPTPTVTVTVTPHPTSPTAVATGPAEPTRFETVRLGRSGREVDVPDGWKQVDQSDTWHDFLDPTLNLRLRIRFDKVGADAKAAAEAAFAKRGDELADFRSPGVDRITTRLHAGTSREQDVTYYEFRFTSQEKEGVRYGVEWYLDGSTMVGGFGWAGQLDLVEPAMLRTLESIVDDGNA
ncbi:hypothetical protein [Tenggerimyces flavus]|uniref:Uncharacterized protein n=1 Tax=Tenggerimyces flavus TaxID=1708749 RepID=A0ABV7Y3S0_9ACTN|nr:hypothetical protein [Tenggerimyces flavus]MBM7790826.1 hypothetical protein [Tenggerimyces flavus]